MAPAAISGIPTTAAQSHFLLLMVSPRKEVNNQFLTALLLTPISAFLFM